MGGRIMDETTAEAVRKFLLMCLAMTFLSATGWFPLLIGIANLTRYVPIGKKYCTEPVTARIDDVTRFAGKYRHRIRYEYHGGYYERTVSSRKPLGERRDDLTIFVNPKFPREFSLTESLHIDFGLDRKRSDIGLSIGLIVFGIFVMWVTISYFTS